VLAPQRTEIGVEEDDVEAEQHPEGVDRPAAGQQQPGAGTGTPQQGQTDQPAQATVGHRNAMTEHRAGPKAPQPPRPGAHGPGSILGFHDP